MKVTNLLSFLSIIFLIGLYSCDKCNETREFVKYEPVYIAENIYNASVSYESARDIANPGIIVSYGNYLFINEYNQGIHVVNNEIASQPVNEGFIAINNNKHFAIKDGIILANRYRDLVAVDIQNPQIATELNRVKDVFPDESEITENGIISHYNASTEIATQDCDESLSNVWWMEDDIFVVDQTAFSAESMSLSQRQSIQTTGSSTSSSMARFVITKNMLYILSQSTLEIFALGQAVNPTRSNTISVSDDVETLFPLNDYLFIGGRSGMSIYDLSTPDQPQFLSNFEHTFSCDPVVANNKNAYVTLRSGRTCAGFVNQLDVLDIENISNPRLTSSHNLLKPQGLSLAGDHLLVCDDENGVVIFDIASNEKPVVVGTFTEFKARDVLAFSNTQAVVSGSDGIFQIDFSDVNSPKLLSTIFK